MSEPVSARHERHQGKEETHGVLYATAPSLTVLVGGVTVETSSMMLMTVAAGRVVSSTACDDVSTTVAVSTVVASPTRASQVPGSRSMAKDA